MQLPLHHPAIDRRRAFLVALLDRYHELLPKFALRAEKPRGHEVHHGPVLLEAVLQRVAGQHDAHGALERTERSSFLRAAVAKLMALVEDNQVRAFAELVRCVLHGFHSKHVVMLARHSTCTAHELGEVVVGHQQEPPVSSPAHHGARAIIAGVHSAIVEHEALTIGQPLAKLLHPIEDDVGRNYEKETRRQLVLAQRVHERDRLQGLSEAHRVAQDAPTRRIVASGAIVIIVAVVV